MARYRLFISDLHLCTSRPSVTADFLQWLAQSASQADALYILGDFFEYWAGDDILDADLAEAQLYQSVAQALKALSKTTPVYLMHGNRDFLMGARFCEASGAKLLPDPSLIDCYGHRVLLSHGDALCTDDHEYMAFKAQVRQPAWQTQFLAQSLDQRLAFIADARARSDAQKSTNSMAIMDVNQTAVAALFAEYDYPPYLIHGHTHRPKQHTHTVAGRTMTRWVLGDWYDQGSCLKFDENGEVSVAMVATA